jgi:hypothetical protein
MDKPPVQNTDDCQQSDNLASMLGAIASQIQEALQDSNAPAATLVETAHSMSKATQTVARCLFDFSGSPARVFQDLMVLHDELHARASDATTAIQFHDRLVQCLTHVCSNLSSLAEFVSSGGDLKSAAQWSELQERMARLQGSGNGAGKVELF